MMKHTFNISIAALSVAALSLLATGCQKQDKLGLNDGDAPLSFSVGVAGEADFEQTGSDGRATKADNRKNSGSTIDNFKVAGYADASVWFEEQTVSTSSMVYNNYIWRSGTQHTFYAYANLPASGATASIASDGVTLNYTAVPTAQASQQDILLGSYKGKGTNGKASIQFYHPLAAVAFKVGEISGVTKISGITLDGVYSSGSVKLSETSGTPAFAWTASETQNGVKQTGLNVTTFTADTKIGDPFILIPQTFSSKPLTVKIALTTAEGDKTVTATLNTGSIAAGKMTVYTISYSTGKELTFTASVSDYGTSDGIEACFVVAGQAMPPADEIWYTTSDNQPITGTDGWKTSTQYFGVKLISNTYTSGIGVLKFEGDIIKIDRYLFNGRDNLQSLMLPSSPDIKLMESSLLTSNNCTIYVPDIYKAANFNASSYGVLAGFYSDITHTITFVTSKGTFPIRGCGGYIILGDGTLYQLSTTVCFTKGTLITLADGSRKPVEELKFDDKLKVWNFDKGCEDSADILWMMQGRRTSPYYFKCTFSDGTVFNIIGKDETACHRVFDKTQGKFLYPQMMESGDKVYTENGLVTLVSCEKIEEEVGMYNVVTVGHINCFANGILTSARYNNRYPIDQNMKFVKDDRKFRPYSEFRKAGISREWYDGMRLAELRDSSIVRIKEYYISALDRGDMNSDWKEPGFFARIWQNIRIWWHNLFV